MKVRVGFVANSSSSSFIAFGITLPETEAASIIIQLAEELLTKDQINNAKRYGNQDPLLAAELSYMMDGIAYTEHDERTIIGVRPNSRLPDDDEIDLVPVDVEALTKTFSDIIEPLLTPKQKQRARRLWVGRVES